MAIPAMALLQQHDARRDMDILIEPAARRRAGIEGRGHSGLRAFVTGGVRNWGRNRAVKTNRLVSYSVVVCISRLMVIVSLVGMYNDSRVSTGLMTSTKAVAFNTNSESVSVKPTTPPRRPRTFAGRLRFFVRQV